MAMKNQPLKILNSLVSSFVKCFKDFNEGEQSLNEDYEFYKEKDPFCN